MHTDTRLFIYTYVCTYIVCTDTHRYTYIRTYICRFVYIHTCTYIDMYIYTIIRTYMHIHSE